MERKAAAAAWAANAFAATDKKGLGSISKNSIKNYLKVRCGVWEALLPSLPTHF
jgi:hypothetical protein